MWQWDFLSKSSKTMTCCVFSGYFNDPISISVTIYNRAGLRLAYGCQPRENRATRKQINVDIVEEPLERINRVWPLHTLSVWIFIRRGAVATQRKSKVLSSRSAHQSWWALHRLWAPLGRDLGCLGAAVACSSGAVASGQGTVASSLGIKVEKSLWMAVWGGIWICE